MTVAEIRHLRLLATLADEGSLHAAARRLHVSPSALSQQLRDLEERIGGPLFERRWKRLSPTAAGLRFIDGSQAVLAELERVERETRTLLAGAKATLRIAMGCHQSYRWLPEVLARFAKLAPDVDVSLVAEAAAAPAEWLLDHKLDLALVTGRSSDRRIRTTRLFRDELVAVVGRRHRWASLARVEPASFAGEQLFADDRALAADAPLGRALLEAGVRPRKLTEVPMTGTVALDLVRANLGVTIMPRWTVAPMAPARDFALVRVGPRGLWLEWSIATRDEPREGPLGALVATVRAVHPRARRR
jgi:LysR family transcriptional regulator, regulator for metE and metH